MAVSILNILVRAPISSILDLDNELPNLGCPARIIDNWQPPCATTSILVYQFILISSTGYFVDFKGVFSEK